MKGAYLLAAASGVGAASVLPKDLQVGSQFSVRNVAATIAHDAMEYYTGNTSNNAIDIGDLQDPYYWWVAGNLWGVMLDYYHMTKDPTYNDVVIEALLNPTNTGPDFNFHPPEHSFEQGNDDLFFWSAGPMAAAERNFPQPNPDIPSWLELSENAFNDLISRWHTEKCGGGLLWQIYEDNPNGMTYKNSVSNGGLFHLAARLARATSNDTYLDWANKVWDWTFDIGLIDADNYHVYDGTSIENDCQDVNRMSFTYTSGILLYGAAVMANHTGEAVWADRASRLLDGADWFFSPFDNSTDVLYEAACEKVGTCNADMTTHKGTLARFMWQSTWMQPDLRPKVERLLTTSAEAAARSCSGGPNERTCGLRWYTGGFDGDEGLGQQMVALETILGLLVDGAAPPLKAGEIEVVRDINWEPIDTWQPDP